MSTQGIHCHETGEYWPTCKIVCKDLGVHNNFFYYYFNGKKPKALQGLTFIKVDERFCIKCGCLLTKENWAEWERSYVCLSCRSKYCQEHYLMRVRGEKLKKLYGITLNSYNIMLEKQNHCCAICGKHKSKFKKRLSVDHNHDTGIVRQLLCVNCNMKLGWFEDNKNKVLEYIEKG